MVKKDVENSLNAPKRRQEDWLLPDGGKLITSHPKPRLEDDLQPKSYLSKPKPVDPLSRPINSLNISQPKHRPGEELLREAEREITTLNTPKPKLGPIS